MTGSRRQSVAERGMRLCSPFEVIRIVVAGPGSEGSIAALKQGMGGWDG